MTRFKEDCVDLEVEVEQNIERYVLYDFLDGETQATFVSDFYDFTEAALEEFLEAEEVQECFEKLQRMANDFRQIVLSHYAEAQELPKQFRRDVL